MGLQHSPRIVTDGLVLCLDAADKNSYPGSGNTWTDLSGNGNNGTLTNMSATPFDSGNGGSLVFDGSNDYVDLDNDLSLTNEFTMTCFFKKDTDSVVSFLGRTSESSSSGIKIIFLSNNNLFFRMIGDGPETNFDIGYQTGMNGNWHFVTAVRTSDNVCKASLDGNSLVTGNSLTGTFTPNAVGRNKNNQYWDGNIASIKVYNRALTPQEIQQNYNATKTRFGL